MKKMIGRIRELQALRSYLQSDNSEFIAVYGRRRVGKTFLVRQVADDSFHFYVTGMDNVSNKEQLLNFSLELKRVSGQSLPMPGNWLIAFDQLATYLESLPKGRKILFIDELPWFDTRKSSFIPALEHFWNAWANRRDDIKLIVCGSATSWMVNKLINNRGGLHNRITQRVQVVPFTLSECKAYFEAYKFGYAENEIAMAYMVMGGIPYYLTQMDPQYSLAQNVDMLFFGETPKLQNEFDNLYKALFRSSKLHIQVVTALAEKSKGLTRLEIINHLKLPNNGALSVVLGELESCGFVRKYQCFGKEHNQPVYQLVDFYTLFYFRFVRKNPYQDAHFWPHSLNSGTFNAWVGYAYEMLCLTHIRQIKEKLGISGVQNLVASWSGKSNEAAVQIDLLIDRKDDTINICEMKFSQLPYEISKSYAETLQTKMQVFREVTRTRKSLMLTMMVHSGLKANVHSGMVQNVVETADLFRP